VNWLGSIPDAYCKQILKKVKEIAATQGAQKNYRVILNFKDMSHTRTQCKNNNSKKRIQACNIGISTGNYISNELK